MKQIKNDNSRVYSGLKVTFVNTQVLSLVLLDPDIYSLKPNNMSLSWTIQFVVDVQLVK